MFYVIEEIEDNSGICSGVICARTDREKAQQIADALNTKTTAKNTFYVVCDEEQYLRSETSWISDIVKSVSE